MGRDWPPGGGGAGNGGRPLSAVRVMLRRIGDEAVPRAENDLDPESGAIPFAAVLLAARAAAEVVAERPAAPARPCHNYSAHANKHTCMAIQGGCASCGCNQARGSIEWCAPPDRRGRGQPAAGAGAVARRGGELALPAFPAQPSPSVSKLSRSSIVRRLERYGTRFFVELRSC